jgi:hypothetical protein
MVASTDPAYLAPQRPATVPDQARHQMSRFERGQYFEALCGLRDAYSARSDDDRRSSLMITDAILYAEAVMHALDHKDSAADIAADAGIATETETMAAGDPRD